MISAIDARNIIVNDEKVKVFKDIENYAKKGKYEVGLLQMSEDVEIELVKLGYDVTRDEGGVFVNWETPKPIEIDVVEAGSSVIQLPSSSPARAIYDISSILILLSTYTSDELILKVRK